MRLDDETFRQVLSAVCDTLLPALDAPDTDTATSDYYGRGARERGLDEATSAAVPGLARHVREAIDELAAFLAERDFIRATLERRTELLHLAAEQDMRLRLAVRQLKGMVFAGFVGAVDESGTNPTWPVIGYPGPPSGPFSASTALPVVAPHEGTLHADVCVVGSGAGGAIIAARAAQAGLSVVVLEAGPHRDEADFDQIDAHASEMYLRGGSLWSDNGQMGVLAGSVLGGGTLINSMVCLRTPMAIREQWAREGLEGLDGPEFDRHLDTVWQRLDVNTEATVYNANTRAMITGLASCGYAHERLPRNSSAEDDPTRCGSCNAGCRLGCKRSTLHTYLRDAADAGARIVAECRADRVLVEDGRAVGVAATLGDGAELVVLAPVVVVAAGGIESPALLLRSGIGGPAVGRNLRLHPAWIVTGLYDQPIHAWSGQIQSAVSFDLTHCESGVGFLVESLTLNPLTWAGQSPFTDARSHRDRLRDLPYFATWHGVSHDHGSGQVYLDADGQAAVRWALDDEIDRRVALRAHLELARMHHAAGANEIFTFHWSDLRWRRGEDFDGYLDELRAVPADDYTAFSAHQMGSCRMGASPEDSVADGHGRLHDVRGVWIGDASALPSAPGVNPMITIMALAERTALSLIETARSGAAAGR
ncbi:FAD-dependent oxidoreductase [Streptosporangium sp. NPDC000509]|uniref:FAD-dependent oxidoreductase n=1 Tax=Streptosporangium sp. NPDC000509 TaxID=3366186 RepID=UPI00368D5A41